MYILQVCRKTFDLFNRHQRFKFILLMIFFLVSATIQIVGVASIGPFIAMISSPQSIHENAVLSKIYIMFDFASDRDFIIACAVGSLSMIVISNAVSVITLWLLMKFSVYFGEDLQARLFLNFIGRPYIYHKTVNYTKAISIISQEAPRYVYMVLQPMLLLFSNIFVAIIILAGLVVLNPFIALGSGLLIGGAYLFTYIGLKSALLARGKILTERNALTQSIVSEAFIGIKDIILNSIGNRYANLYRNINMQGLKSTAFISLSGDIPKFIIETISFGAILLLAIVFLLRDEPSATIVSMLSIYALAGYKLLPTMQQIYKSISVMGAHGEVAFELSKELSAESSVLSGVNVKPLHDVSTIDLNNIVYTYPGAAEPALRNVNVSFQLGKLTTIVGHSGSGKSTLVDVVLGLLQAESGVVAANGVAITGDYLLQYQKSIGYLPQTVFILDDSVIANVAFGLPKDEIDLDKVVAALTQANAIDFVMNMPGGLHANLGQDGKLLSGGQKQRIGIARSLYRDTKILILDEPTSALDIQSEYEFMQLMKQLKQDILIILISHRPAAIQASDAIVLMDGGRVIASGGYDELLAGDRQFADMMNKSWAD